MEVQSLLHGLYRRSLSLSMNFGGPASGSLRSRSEYALNALSTQRMIPLRNSALLLL
jgi:hypothetical protein